MNKSIWMSLWLSIGLSCSAQQCIADIYKYQDANGKWHFTDKKPENETQGATEVISVQARNEPQYPSDIAAELQKKFKPATAVENATLNVVKIQTDFGSGSGFFVSDKGHIITNYHVIQPETPNLDAAFKERKASLDNAKQSLNRREKDLQLMKKDIKNKEGYLELVNVYDYQILVKEIKADEEYYEEYSKRYENDLKIHEDARKKYDEEYNAYYRSRLFAGNAKNFTVILKDNTSLNATLISESKELDLALIKIEGYKTPYFNLNASAAPSRQGETVYAIGSPLGLKDYVTSGIIASVRPDAIVTDSQVLPGNSGGPLVNQAGQVIAVNTQKISSGNDASSQGFGIGIPVTQVLQQFGQIIK